MYEKFKNPHTLKNPRLYSLVLQARQLYDQDYWKSGKTILAVIKKILPLAKKEREWYLYLETFYHLLYFETEFGNKLQTVVYSQIFFRESIQYFDEASAQYPGSILKKYMVMSYDDIFDAYKLCSQINEEKWERFWMYFKIAADCHGYGNYYWRCRLEFAILNRNKEMAEGILKEYEREQVDFAYNCYACNRLVVMGYYILIGETDLAKELSDQIIGGNVPKRAFWMYDDCPRSTLRCQYGHLLHYSLRTGNPEAFSRFLPDYLEAVHNEGRDTNTYIAYCRAAAGDFSGMEEEIPIAADDAEKFSSFPAWEAMEDMLCWMAYFRKLWKTGTANVRVNGKAFGTLPLDEEGFCGTQELSRWFEKEADRLGADFEKNWKDFTYEPLKESYKICCGLFLEDSLTGV